MTTEDERRCSRPLKVTYTKTRPEMSVEDYKISLGIAKIDKLKPQIDVVRKNDPPLTLATIQTTLRETDKLLRQKRRNQKKTRLQLDEQWVQLAQKEKDFRNNFLSFNTFVIENREKKNRATRKIEDDKALCENRQVEIDKLKVSHTKIEMAKKQMEAKIKEYRKFELYLDDVVDTSAGEFKNIQGITNRYISLIYAKNQLAGIQEANLVALENARNDMMKIIEEKNLVIMGLNNQIANLQARFENANIKALECEQLVMRIKNNAVRIINEIDEVKASLWNTYLHMSVSKKHPVKIKKENVEEQALFIKRTLTELAKINNILRKPGKLAKMKLKMT